MLTPYQRLLKEQKIEVLQLVLDYFKECGETYICCILQEKASYSWSPREDLRDAAMELVEYIESSLGKHRDGLGLYNTLDSWQQGRGLVGLTDSAIPGSRTAWVKWIIECLKEDLENADR